MESHLQSLKSKWLAGIPFCISGVPHPRRERNAPLNCSLSRAVISRDIQQNHRFRGHIQEEGTAPGKFIAAAFNNDLLIMLTISQTPRMDFLSHSECKPGGNQSGYTVF